MQFAFGHQHLGVTQAAITAELIADQLAGRPSDINLAPFRVDRFE
ncbi:FAD-binding oxidoreductase [Vreelandella venusta]|nr:FAD-binding oxidoreductase [Halomonas venusta]QPI64587.1 FAD-binding oxidoreductase [Halomonas venusta]